MLSRSKLNLGTKNCLECNSIIQLRKKRDLLRKKFCSRKCSNTYYGKRLPKERIEKMLKACNTPESNAKKAHKGENHPMYIKDRSKLKGKRDRYELNQWRKSIFERDNYTCQYCNQRGGKLQADHIKPYSVYPELRSDLNNGRTLCIECHKKTDTYGWKIRWKIARGEYGTSTQ